MILRYAIGVADFLDSGAFEGCISQSEINSRTTSRNNETMYWRAEETRRCLQLVCKSWDLYLRGFEHRFVRMLDIQHKTLDSPVLEKAIRVSFGKYGCRCELCLSSAQRFEEFCYQAIAKAEEVKMEIADMMEEDHQISDFSPWRNFHNVRALIAPSCGYCGYFAEVVGRLKSLRHFYGKGYRGTKENWSSSLISQNLVTLSFHDRKGSNYAEVEWDLPSLRHLRFKDDSNEELDEFVPKALIPLLRSLGSQLISFYLYNRNEEYDLPEQIWDLCPHMEIFRTNMSLVSPPPYFHPIHTLVVDKCSQLKNFKGPPEWPNLGKVAIDQNWKSISAEHRLTSLDERPDLRVEDRSGLTAEEYAMKEKAIEKEEVAREA